MSKMNKQIIKTIEEEFCDEDKEFVLNQLNSIALKHVMAESETNLNNTRLAVLKLSKGKATDLPGLVESAKKDFRDVIYWSSLQK